jgi:hypothetical protein
VVSIPLLPDCPLWVYQNGWGWIKGKRPGIRVVNGAILDKLQHSGR